MEQDRSFITQLVGKTVWVTTATTAGGVGTKDASAGNYKGVLLDFDGHFLKLEYEMKKFVSGAGLISKGVILINVTYVMTVEEYKESLNPVLLHPAAPAFVRYDTISIRTNQ